MENLIKDVRYGIRSLLKRPAFALIAVITLALGIGANTAIFSVINAVLLLPLRYPQPEQLITFRSNQSAPDLTDTEKQCHALQSIGGLVVQPLDYTAGNEPVQIKTGLVTGGFFETLGIKAERGRVITPSDDSPGSPYTVVLSHSLWLRLFSGDQNIVGKPIPLSGNVYTIIGVMPPDFASPRDDSEAWVGVHLANPVAADFRGVHFLQTYGRLAPGMTLEQARAEMRLIDNNLAAQYPADNKNRQTALIPLHERITGESRQALLVLFAAVSLVLLIACANYANLLLARAAERERELVIRAALGAGRWRLIRQLLTESILISLAGGAIAVLIANWGISLLVALKPESIPRLQEIVVDVRVLIFTFALSLLTGTVFGLLPAWSASRRGISDALSEAGRGGTSGRARRRLRSTFVVVELALALMLMVGAGLLIKTFWKLRSVEPGFNPAHLVTMRIELPETRYKERDKQTRFRTQVLTAINSLPRVEAAMISELPLSGDWLDHDFLIEGRPPMAPGDEPSLNTRSIMGNYFHVMHIPLRIGRDFDPQDFTEASPLVGIANQAMVQEYFPNEDPVGKRVRWARDPEIHWMTIVGVVGDVKHFGLDVPEQPAFYSPYTQAAPWKRWMIVIVRTEQGSTALVQKIKQEIWKVDPLLPITKVQTMSEVAAESFSARRFNMYLLATFAGLALVLAAVGVYGVMSYVVTQRTQEIGVRMALGARADDVLKLILENALVLAVIGVIIGAVGALAVTRLMTSLLFGVAPTDWVTFLSVSFGLIIVVLVACYFPARRATKVDPLVALRYE